MSQPRIYISTVTHLYTCHVKSLILIHLRHLTFIDILTFHSKYSDIELSNMCPIEAVLMRAYRG